VIPGSVILEVMGFKVLEATKFRKLDMLNFSDVAVDCFVKVDDFGVGKRKGSEKLKNVFGILLQFKGMVVEGTEDSGGCGVPGNGPISMGLEVIEGLVPLTERSKSPMVVEILSSAIVEKSPEKTTSRLTAIPERTCFHSGFGNGGRDPADWSDQSACLRLVV